MLLCAAGDIHGAIDRLYADVVAFESALGIRFEWVLHVGDFGVWPDPDRVDKATRKHEGAGDFPSWFADRRAAPRKTIFVKGNHEDFVWLDSHNREEILPGLFYLRNGRAMNLGKGRDCVRVGGMGGCFGPSDYERHSKHLQVLREAPLHARRDRRSLSALRDRRAARARRSRGSEVREPPTRSGIRERGGGSRRPHQPRSPAGLLLRSPSHQAQRRGRGHPLCRTEQGRDARKPRRRGARDPWTRVVAPWRVADAPVGGRDIEARPALTAASTER
jgi:hypothetical protein